MEEKRKLITETNDNINEVIKVIDKEMINLYNKLNTLEKEILNIEKTFEELKGIKKMFKGLIIQESNPDSTEIIKKMLSVFELQEILKNKNKGK
jgi:hypothetical protein